MIVVLGLTVFVDLMIAVGVGLVLKSLLFVKRMADLQLASIGLVGAEDGDDALSPDEADLLKQSQGRILLLRLAGPLSFGAANGLVRRISVISGYDALVLDFSDLSMIDSSGSLAIEQIIGQARANGRQVLVSGLAADARSMLDRLDVLTDLGTDDITATRKQALDRAAARVDGTGDRERAPPTPVPPS